MSSGITALPADINPALVPVIGVKLRSSPYTDIELHLHLEKPNPWDLLEAYKQPYYHINNSTSPAAKLGLSRQVLELFRLTELPLEVIYCIAEMLPPESAACLALVNKTFYEILAHRFLKLETYSRWRFLVLLEKDMIFLVACADCMTLHSPLIAWDENTGMSCLNQDLERGLPHSITYPIVRLIAKTHLQNLNHSEILGYTNQYFTHFGKSLQYNDSSSCRVVKGNLLQRRQIVVRPLRGDTMTMRSLYKLGRVLNPHYFEPLCHHKAWYRATSVDLRVHADKIADCHNQAHHNTTEGMHIGMHRELCFSRKDAIEILGEKGLKSGMTKTLHHTLFAKEAKGSVGRIQGCKKCFTDYCVTFVDVDDAGRCVVLTSWKDLGGLGPDEKAKWDSHRFPSLLEVRRRGAPERDLGRSKESLGQIFCAWEDMDPATTNLEDHLYIPELGRRLVRDLQEAATDEHESFSQVDEDKTDDSDKSNQSDWTDEADEADDH
ncbi:hypothetical protein UCRPA7_1971 [Phaeoacremonium minimum UCRPA7]|uniref:F-box domain-containing protein n=1 Tax=Phaeoacremonium minimum (strain UCR-PA7) TaxID=1286976 RepID=R8BT01_PHAM7|nr:hypothetical protein UCRPA7_1971 [Phaeoacremonium minimum UCRPA7]EOO02512.1 hypothetical protein UCRPA7_1971 [Phaeoacremonium minimum UCRPA7]